MASADSKFDDMPDADIDSLIDDAILKTPQKKLLGEYLYWKVRLRIWIFQLN